ncbi:MAG: carboxypeptidase M32 [Pirellulaceae bacterium]
MSESLYKSVVTHCRRVATYKSALALLEWDQQTYMPTQGGEFRAEQISQLSGEIHRLSTGAEYGKQLEELFSSDWITQQSHVIQANVRELNREFDKSTRLSQTLVEELAKACSVGQMTWIESRKTNDFNKFLPYLKSIFQLKQRQADAIGFQENRYDALLDDYEPHCRASEIAPVLKNLCDALVPLIQTIGESTHRPDETLVKRNFPVVDQDKFGRVAASKIGFDFNRGRLDVTHHPFCTELGPNDCRITTRYDENHFNSAFFGILHEAGHGIYEQGLDGSEYGLPAGKYASLGVHESQSRLWENLVGRHAAFWKFFFPLAQQHFPDSLGSVGEEEFYRAINAVRPSLIRVEADEATYNLHIAIRFELELELINDQLTCEDLPAAWNDRYEQYLGVRPDSDANGVMQDIHWSAGLIGYFPTYSLGNLFAAQLFNAAKGDIAGLEQGFANGDFVALKSWLNERVHAVGQTLAPNDLIKQVTGLPLSHDALLQQLQDKYQVVYRL